MVDDEGFDYMKMSFLRDIKAQQRSLRYVYIEYYLHIPYNQVVSFCHRTHGICRDYSKTYARSKYYDEAKPWNERCDIAFPCASQNEIDQSDAMNLANAGCHILVEGTK